MPRTLSALVLAGLLVSTLGAPAQAHSGLIAMVPADGSQVSTAPEAVTLTFDEPVDSDGTSVGVTGPTGQVVSRGATSVVGATVQQSLGPMSSAGRYTVSFRITSEDGHPVTATRTFSLSSRGVPARAAGATPVGSAQIQLAATSDGDGGSTTLIAVLAVIALVLVGAIGAVGLRRRTDA